MVYRLTALLAIVVLMIRDFGSSSVAIGVFNPDIGSVSVRFFRYFGISVSKI